jgi:hypothetical protein
MRTGRRARGRTWPAWGVPGGAQAASSTRGYRARSAFNRSAMRGFSGDSASDFS